MNSVCFKFHSQNIFDIYVMLNWIASKGINTLTANCERIQYFFVLKFQNCTPLNSRYSIQNSPTHFFSWIWTIAAAFAREQNDYDSSSTENFGKKFFFPASLRFLSSRQSMLLLVFIKWQTHSTLFAVAQYERPFSWILKRNDSKLVVSKMKPKRAKNVLRSVWMNELRNVGRILLANQQPKVTPIKNIQYMCKNKNKETKMHLERLITKNIWMTKKPPKTTDDILKTFQRIYFREPRFLLVDFTYTHHRSVLLAFSII